MPVEAACTVAAIGSPVGLIVSEHVRVFRISGNSFPGSVHACTKRVPRKFTRLTTSLGDQTDSHAGRRESGQIPI